ncbi:hypothetical protein [Sinomicrobium weinanense]|uniref:Uncharacterized protein n=1 Tax=Sinomicrobium weinanense TaxID=2842200 RepID=A0A926JRX5_9FLAO|nr:hypothetical protein [Sinomicrobium weinanense]MBC9796397.1 hypothetical protein [Sinomicrobium weinanense]MBU3122602.1 hypothetical protein [Sinomicrobium weinanense]
MIFGFIIFTRLLFIACMVFVIGHEFGSFSKNRVLRRITRVAAILAVVLFFFSTGFAMRGTPWRGHCFDPQGRHYKDSTMTHQGYYNKPYHLQSNNAEQ